MASVLLLPYPLTLALVSIEVNEEVQMITATARTTSREARCPLVTYGCQDTPLKRENKVI